jgi:hypothetical protein
MNMSSLFNESIWNYRLHHDLLISYTIMQNEICQLDCVQNTGHGVLNYNFVLFPLPGHGQFMQQWRAYFFSPERNCFLNLKGVMPVDCMKAL